MRRRIQVQEVVGQDALDEGGDEDMGSSDDLDLIESGRAASDDDLEPELDSDPDDNGYNSL